MTPTSGELSAARARVSRGALAICLATAGVAAAASCAGPSAELHASREGARAGAAGASREVGKATYYAPRLAGHRTASGELYDPRQLTAAHPVLPFGTRVAVQRTDVDLPAVVVRINDRCAAGKKIIDLSEAAAHRLHMIQIGIVPVRLQVLTRPPGGAGR